MLDFLIRFDIQTKINRKETEKSKPIADDCIYRAVKTSLFTAPGEATRLTNPGFPF